MKSSTTLLDALLESDARSVLLTPKFVVFLQLLVEEIAANPTEFPYPLQISADPDVWLLPSLPMALRVYRLPEQNTADEIGVRMELGEWRQVFRLPIEERSEAVETTIPSWSIVAAQLQQAMPQLPISPALQFFLAQELLCILCYLSEFGFAD